MAQLPQAIESRQQRGECGNRRQAEYFGQAEEQRMPICRIWLHAIKLTRLPEKKLK
jgi:hypothetical protein